MALKEKSRILDKRHIHLQRQNYWPDGSPNGGPSIVDFDVYSREFTRSEGHRWPKDRGVRDAGGPFAHLILRYRNPDYGYYHARTGEAGWFQTATEGNAVPLDYGFPGVFTVDGQNMEYYQYNYFDNPSNLAVAGTNFIASTIPTNPIVDGSVSLAELFREGIPSMIGSILLKEKAAFFRSLGSEYLNVQFGWKPLIADLQNAARAIVESDSILRQLAENSGKDLHRHAWTPESTTAYSTFSNAEGAYTPSLLNPSEYSPVPWYTVEDKTRRKTWFSGCYTYYFDPAVLSQASRIATEARILYGIELTPEVLWNLAPWSWLVDWFANVGPMLHNVSAFQSDGLVLKYGYVMEKSKRTIKRRNSRGRLWQQGFCEFPSRYYDEFFGELKRREKATPFGFGLNSTDFTVRQWTILGALGITRAPRTL